MMIPSPSMSGWPLHVAATGISRMSGGIRRRRIFGEGAGFGRFARFADFRMFHHHDQQDDDDQPRQIQIAIQQRNAERRPRPIEQINSG